MPLSPCSATPTDAGVEFMPDYIHPLFHWHAGNTLLLISTSKVFKDIVYVIIFTTYLMPDKNK